MQQYNQRSPLKHSAQNAKHQHTVKLSQSVASTTTSRSTKLKNFLWNKLASVKKHSNSSMNLSPTGVTTASGQVVADSSTTTSSNPNNKLIAVATTVYAGGGNGPEKKQRRNIFHLFESSSRMKLQTGSNKKSATKSKNVNFDPKVHSARKTPTPNQIDNDLLINPAKPSVSTTSSPSRSIHAATTPANPEIDIESCPIKVSLIDNSMVKSKIHAASRRQNFRKQPTTNPGGTLSAVNSSFKNSLTEFSSNSFANNLRIVDGEDEPSTSILLTNDVYTDKMDMSQSTEKSTSETALKSLNLVSSRFHHGHSQHRSSSASSSAAAKLMNTSRSIDSSSSLTTNLLEINEDGNNVDLFTGVGLGGGSGHFLLNQSKSGHDSSQYAYDDDDMAPHGSSKENLSRSPAKKKLIIDSLKSEEFIKIEPLVINEEPNQTKLLSKTIIYDNNFTNHHYGTTTSCRPKNSATSIDSSFYSSQSADFKSKSCERLNTHLIHFNSPKPETAIRCEAVVVGRLQTKPISPMPVDKNNLDCLISNKKLSYSKSLKLVPQQSVNPIGLGANKFAGKPGLESYKNRGGSTNLNDRTNLVINRPNTNNITKITEVSNEPSWKELAQRKHTAWSQKNLERRPVESQNNKSDSDKDSMDEKTQEGSPTEGKVKSMISKFA